jgi:teichuronic acid biosynthesis glycosyltransferase TuaC
MFPSAKEPQFGIFVKEQADDLRSLGIGVDVLSFDGRRTWTRYGHAVRSVRRLVGRQTFDLVHGHYGLCGAVALTQRRVPVVTTFHGSDFSGAVPWQLHVSRVVARFSTPIFVNDEGAMRLHPGASVIPAGVDVDVFRPIDREEARRKLRWPISARYVLFPSRRGNKIKGADLFEAVVEAAAARAPDLRGVYLGGYTREEVALVLNAVDVVLMTSEREGSPVTVRESLACQTPVVSVPVGDVPKVLAGLPGCAVVSREVASLARAVLEAFDAGRPSGLRRRAEAYSRRRIAERVLRVYERVLEA